MEKLYIKGFGRKREFQYIRKGQYQGQGMIVNIKYITGQGIKGQEKYMG